MIGKKFIFFLKNQGTICWVNVSSIPSKTSFSTLEEFTLNNGSQMVATYRIEHFLICIFKNEVIGKINTNRLFH
jgi:hypothetical protein